MLLMRTIGSVILIAGLTLVLWLDHEFTTDVGFQLILLAAVVISVEEFYGMTREKGYAPFRWWGTLCAGLLVLADCAGRHEYHVELHLVGIVAFVFLLGLFLLQGWWRPRPHGLIAMAITAFAIVYVWGLANFVARIRYLWPDDGTQGVFGVIWMIAVVKLSDIGAYLVGRRLGRHRPFPNISPGKSVEGYLAGLGGALVGGFVGGWLMFRFAGWREWLVFAVLVYIFGALGDLFESIIKRDLGRKDSGRFPGLGGVLDVFDSILLASPVAFYVLEQMFRQGVSGLAG